MADLVKRAGLAVARAASAWPPSNSTAATVFKNRENHLTARHMPSVVTVVPSAPADLDAVIDRIVIHVAPARILVFGSHARGDASGDSDVDLLIVWDTPLAAAERSRAIRQVIAPLKQTIGLDIVVLTSAEYHREATRRSVLGAMIREGVEVHVR